MRTRLCVSGGKAQSITKSAIEVELESVVLGIATGREIADLPDLRKRRKQSRGISRGARGQAAVDIGQRLDSAVHRVKPVLRENDGVGAVTGGSSEAGQGQRPRVLERAGAAGRTRPRRERDRAGGGLRRAVLG